MSELRPIVALGHVGKCNDPGRAPEVVFLTIGQLVVNDEYQRGISKASQNRIRKMAKAWDWSSYKAITVAKTADAAIFEIVDGQHTAMAAASNGQVHLLPCLLVAAETLQDKARSFIGINTAKAGLTPMNIYKSQIAAQDPVALNVQVALDASGCRMLEVMPNRGLYAVGDTMAVGTLMTIARERGAERLSILLRICKAAACAPVSSKMVKALNLAYPTDAPKSAEATQAVFVRVIGGQGSARLEMIASSRTAAGGRDYETLADMLADMAKLPKHRMGRKAAAVRKGRAPRVPDVRLAA